MAIDGRFFDLQVQHGALVNGEHVYVDQHLDSIFTRERGELYLVRPCFPPGQGHCPKCGAVHEYYTIDCRPALFTLEECAGFKNLDGPYPPDAANTPRYARVGVTLSLLPLRFNDDGTSRSEAS